MEGVTGMSIKRFAVQGVLSAALVLVGHAADHLLSNLGGLGLLDFGATTAFVGGLSFGWAALPGSLLGWLTQGVLVPGASFSPGVLVAGLLLATSGAALLRIPPRFGWTLVSFETYAAAVMFCGVGAGAAAWAVVATHGPATMNAFWSSWERLAASLILLAALLLRLVNRLVRPWIKRVWLPELPPARPERASTARWLLVVALTAAVALVVRQALGQPPILHEWARLLFVLPIVLLGRFGLREGILAGSLAGVASLVADLPDLTATAAGVGTYLSRQATATIFPFFGAVLGWAFEREWQTRNELRGALANTVQALRSSLAVRHVYTEDHTVRVARYAVATGRHLGLEGAELEDLETAGLLHDIGKIGVPDAILRKPGPLRWREAEQMRQHPEIGARLLQQVSGLEAAVPLVLHHQERYDGRTVGPHPGYPDGLAGEAIPLGSRIIAVVDAFDAMTTDREYREAQPVEDAIAELRAGSGKQFDPQVVDAFVEVLAARPWRFDDATAQEDEASVLEFVAERLREGARKRQDQKAETEPQAK